MVNKIVKAILTVLGMVLGYELSVLILKILKLQNFVNITLSNNSVLTYNILSGFIGGLILFLLSSRLIKWGLELTKWLEYKIQKIPTNDIFIGVLGLIIGLLIGNLISYPIVNIPFIGKFLPILINIFFGYLGFSIAFKKKEDIGNLFFSLKKLGGFKDKGGKQDDKVVPKILDTSVIIDGRIFDILKTGFIEGSLIVPNFVLEELRHIADSSDTLKRNRGRRGLDILNKMQKELNIKVEIIDKNFDGNMEVDSKLLKLAKMMNAKIITNDYNLNKVAEFQGVMVLNINELSNAVKPILLPGEEMVVHIVKDGKEAGQGVAYLDDGTMIVVDGGKKYIGESIDVIVTSVLQTAAGRMIFAKPKIQSQEKVV